MPQPREEKYANIYLYLQKKSYAQNQSKSNNETEFKEKIFGKLQILEEYFADILNLDVINQHILLESSSNSYIIFAQKVLVYALNILLKSLANSLDELFNPTENCGHNLNKTITDTTLFCPDSDRNPNPQIATLEAVVKNNGLSPVVLTFVDMLRAVRQLEGQKEIGTLEEKSTSTWVLSLARMQQYSHFWGLLSKAAWLINFNLDPKAPAKWGVLQFKKNEESSEKDGEVTIYCAMPLSTPEKEQLEKILQSYEGNVKFECGNGNNLAQTGFKALAWLNGKVIKNPNYKLGKGEVPSAFDHLYFPMLNEMEEKKIIAELNNSNLVDAGFKWILDSYFLEVGTQISWQAIKNAFVALNILAYSDNILGETFVPGDIKSLIVILKQKNLNKKDFFALYHAARRSQVPGINQLMQEKEIIRENEFKLTKDKINSSFLAACGDYARWLLREYSSEKLEIKNEHYAQIAIGLLLNYIQTHPGESTLSIELDADYQLTPEEQDALVACLANNSVLCNFKINNNPSLQTVKTRLGPILARNRWLAQNSYHPSSNSDPWQQAAKYAFYYVCHHPDLLAQPEKHQAFKAYITETGLTGLKTLLGLFKDDRQRDRFETFLGNLKTPTLPFYLDGRPGELAQCLDSLNTHVGEKFYWPFTQISIGYQAGCDAKLLEFLKNLNQLTVPPEQIKLAAEKVASSQLIGLLAVLTQQALKEDWTVPIIFPSEFVSDEKDKLPIQRTYLEFINTINYNRCQKQMASLPAVELHQTQTKLLKICLTDTSKSDKIDPNTKYPLKCTRVVQQQQQQSQQQQQNQQQQQESQQQNQWKTAEDADAIVFGDLVTYENIDEILGSFWKQHKRENPTDLTYLQKANGETELQCLFRRWVGGVVPKKQIPLRLFFSRDPNPPQFTDKVINTMSRAAVEQLLRYHSWFAQSGIDPGNLPPHFYLVPHVDGGWILDHDPQRLTHRNPLTVCPHQKVHPAALAGDFRRFNWPKYADLAVKTPLDAKDWDNLILFAALQSPQANYTEQYESFCKQNPNIINQLELKDPKEALCPHWLLFMQLWYYQGEAGIKQLRDKPTTELELSNNKIAGILFKNLQNPLKDWGLQQQFSGKTLRAIGHMRCRYGNKGVELLLTKLYQMAAKLGQDDFIVFKKSVLASIDNFVPYMSGSAFAAIDQMCAVLSVDAAKKQAWLAICQQHFAVVKDNMFINLWQAVNFFFNQLEISGIKFGEDLSGAEFAVELNGNWFTYMSRILAIIEKVGAAEGKRFLKNLGEMDLGHIGVYHAAIHGGLKKISDPRLALWQFKDGSPTYVTPIERLSHPPIKGPWQDFREGEAPFPMPEEKDIKLVRLIALRVLACRPLTGEQYEKLAALITEARNKDAVQKVIEGVVYFLLHTRHDPSETSSILEFLTSIDCPWNVCQVGRKLHEAFKANSHFKIDWYVVEKILRIYNQQEFAFYFKTQNIIYFDKQGTFFEVMQVLLKANHWNETTILGTLNFLNNLKEVDNPKGNNSSQQRYPAWLKSTILKLAALFGGVNFEQVKKLMDNIHNAPFAVQEQVYQLAQQLLFIDFEQSNLKALQAEKFAALVACVAKMQEDPEQAKKCRIDFLEALKNQKIVFKVSMAGNFRRLQAQNLTELLTKVPATYRERLQQFICDHLLVPAEVQDPSIALGPFFNFLAELIAQQTELDVVGLLLTSWQKQPKEQFWSVDYLHKLLAALRPREQGHFPVFLLEELLKTPELNGKALDDVATELPSEFTDTLHVIVLDRRYTPEQQLALSRILLNEFFSKKTLDLTQEIIQALTQAAYTNRRDSALKLLADSRDFAQLKQRFASLQWLIKQNLDVVSQTIWLKALAQHASKINDIQTFFASIQALAPEVSENNSEAKKKQKLILQIIAASSLDDIAKKIDLKKIKKLISKLVELSQDVLKILVDRCQQIPRLTTKNVLYLLKKCQANSDGFAAVAANFVPPQVRSDYALLPETRLHDFQRMLAAHLGEHPNQKRIQETSLIGGVFFKLKQFEAGTLQVNEKSIRQLSQTELLSALEAAIKKVDGGDKTTQAIAEMLALLFEDFGRSIKMYPHMLQQLAMIEDELCTGKTRFFQIGCGDGKSIFETLIAARRGLTREFSKEEKLKNSKVYVCMSTDSLTRRDKAFFERFYQSLGLGEPLLLTPGVPLELYEDKRICYVTPQNLALYLDEKRSQGYLLKINPEDYLVLDEGDFAIFNPTQANFATVTMSVEMTWLYAVVNAFYATVKKALENDPVITGAMLNALYEKLQQAAGQDPNKHVLLEQWFGNKQSKQRHLRGLLQAAHIACSSLQAGVDFVVSNKTLWVRKKAYVGHEITPLSADQQLQEGAIFANWVQQLLATHLNQQALEKQEPANHYSSPVSDTLSSRVTYELIRHCGWTALSGTLSLDQKTMLTQQFDTQLFTMPDNQVSQMVWQEPIFYADEAAYLNDVALQINACTAKNKSILICCRNAAQVEWLQKKLSNKEELTGKSIFYIQDSNQIPEEILKQKHDQENWHNGQQNNGVALFAAGFTRGQNPEVAQVISLGPTTIAEVYQEGNRTGRNGKDGKAGAIYLRSDLDARYKDLVEQAVGLGAGDDFTLKGTEPPKDDQACLRLVMALERYVASLDPLQQCYHKRLSSLSNQFMQVAVSTANKSTRAAFLQAIAMLHKELEFVYMEVAQEPGKVAEKIKKLETEITKTIKYFEAACQTDFRLQIKIEFPKVYIITDVKWQKIKAEELPWNQKSNDKADAKLWIQVVNHYVSQAQQAQVTSQLSALASQIPQAELIRLLKQWEAIAQFLGDAGMKTLPLKSFVTVLTQLGPENLPLFERLLKRTHKCLEHKEQRYWPILQNIWQKLASEEKLSKEKIKLLEEVLLNSEDKKLWLAALPPLLVLEPEKLAKYVELIKNIFKGANPNGAVRQRERVYAFLSYCLNSEIVPDYVTQTNFSDEGRVFQIIAVLDGSAAFNQLTQDQYSALFARLLGLDEGKFKQACVCLTANKDLLTTENLNGFFIDSSWMYLPQKTVDKDSELDKQRRLTLEIVGFFQKTAKDNDGFENDAVLNSMFDFSKPEVGDKRTYFMYLLNQGAFIAHSDVGWTEENNQELLQQCLGKYTQETQRILKRDTRWFVPQGDLTNEQEGGLLNISTELNLIGKPRKQSQGKELSQKGTLKTKLDSSINFYTRNMWFKSNDRRCRIKQLQQDIEEAFGNSEQSRYENVLAQIQKAITDILNQDTEINSTRTFFKRVNSALLTTLQTMRSDVEEAWAKVPKAIQSFQAYQAQKMQQFKKLVEEFSKALEQHQEKYIKKDGKQAHWSMRICGQLFFNTHNLNLQDLQTALQAIHTPKENQPLSVEQLQDCLNNLKSTTPHLPGYLSQITAIVTQEVGVMQKYLESPSHLQPPPIAVAGS